jgi:hypothetical protein
MRALGGTHVDHGLCAVLGLHPVQERRDGVAGPDAIRHVRVGEADGADKPGRLAFRQEEVLEGTGAPFLELADRAKQRDVCREIRREYVLDEKYVRGVTLQTDETRGAAGRASGAGRTSCGRISYPKTVIFGTPRISTTSLFGGSHI